MNYDQVMATLRALIVKAESGDERCRDLAKRLMASAAGLPEDAKEYAHEAIEHAALSSEDDLLGRVRAALAFHGVRV